MQERARELKAQSGRGADGKKVKPDGERDLLARVAELQEPDRSMALRTE